MKKQYLILLLLLIGTLSQAQIVTIPDANFKNALVNTPCVDTNGDGTYDSDADTNDDGEIQVTEAEAVIRLGVSSRGINSLEGIESFINVEILYTTNNNLTSLDLSQNVQLRTLVSTRNDLTSIDVTQNTDLGWLWLADNDLTTLDVTQNPNLYRLWVDENELTTLDVTQNPILESLFFEMNQINNLVLGTHLLLDDFRGFQNNLTSLDLSPCPNLGILLINDNELVDLDVSQNTELWWLNCSNNQLTSLDVSQNPDLVFLDCPNNQISELDVTIHSDLVALNCASNQLTDLYINNGNNVNLSQMHSFDNPELYCIQVDDEDYVPPTCTADDGWCKDDFSTYVEDCSTFGIGDETATVVSLYPNPVENRMVLNSNEAVTSIEVYNLGGVLVKQVLDSNTTEVSELASGMYFARITINGKKFTKKFIKR